MRVLKSITTVFCLAIAGLGLLGLAAPDLLLSFARSVLAPPALYAVAAARIVFGVLLIAIASASRAPATLRWLGAFIVVAGLVTPFLQVERLEALLAWLSDRLVWVRGIALAPILIGSLLWLAISPRRPVAS